MSEVVENRPVAVNVAGVKKMYKLGQIGGGSLQADLQSWWARVRHKEDPNSKIGEGERSHGKTFMALNGVDLTIYQGEAIGIIGSNGAGKSTLLKLLSRVTAPTEGVIDIYGRIASMLEVGTGFNPEMTGRENVYLNGAILGMTKAEIDEKMEDIIEFSEVREFIDTPVKRYSSGMFVKLAFSVAAHLDAEIMIMDEVLAVGDMAFQKKCLSKMKEAANQDGRTVLYVSHNMNTIRTLCDRCIVLDKGQVVFNGDVDTGISVYLGVSNTLENNYIYTKEHHTNRYSTDSFVIKSLTINNRDNNRFRIGEKIELSIVISAKKKYDDVCFRFVVKYSDGTRAGTMLSEKGIIIDESENIIIDFIADTSHLMRGIYRIDLIAFQSDIYGSETVIDGVYPGFFIEIEEIVNEKQPLLWQHQYWGHVRLHDIAVRANRRDIIDDI